MSEPLVFEDPPEDGRRRGQWRDRLLDMAEYPNQWVNATKTFGLSPKASGSLIGNAQRAADKLGLRIESRYTGQRTESAAVYLRVLKDES